MEKDSSVELREAMEKCHNEQERLERVQHQNRRLEIAKEPKAQAVLTLEWGRLRALACWEEKRP